MSAHDSGAAFKGRPLPPFADQVRREPGQGAAPVGDRKIKWLALVETFKALPPCIVGILPFGGTYSGRNAVARHAQAFNSTWEGLQDEDERRLPLFFAGGHRVAVLWRQRGHNPQTGEQLDVPAVSIYELRDGTVIESCMFHFDAGAVAGFLERARGQAQAERSDP